MKLLDLHTAHYFFVVVRFVFFFFGKLLNCSVIYRGAQILIAWCHSLSQGQLHLWDQQGDRTLPAPDTPSLCHPTGDA